MSPQPSRSPAPPPTSWSVTGSGWPATSSWSTPPAQPEARLEVILRMLREVWDVVERAPDSLLRLASILRVPTSLGVFFALGYGVGHGGSSRDRSTSCTEIRSLSVMGRV